MNRSNVGNIVTNGMQIMSTAAVTATRVLGRADKVLRNMTPQQREDYYKMQADKRIEETEQYYNKRDSAFRRLNPSEQDDYRDYQADLMRKAMSKDEEGSEDSSKSVDELMAESIIPKNTEQSVELVKRVDDDIRYIKQRRNPLTNHFMSREDSAILDELERGAYADD